MKLKMGFLILLSSFFCTSVLGATPAPQRMLEKVANQLIIALEKNQSAIRHNPNIVNRLVRQTVLPYFDVEEMSRSVIGRNWKKATPSQWQRFKKGFTRLVVNTYSVPLSNYNDEQVKFYPMRGFDTSQSRASVRSLVIRKNGQRIPVNYQLLRKGKKWLVYDFNVEGISMVKSYRAQFSHVISEGGFTALLKKLNRQKVR